MRSGQKITAALLVWGAISAGAPAIADEADKGPAPVPSPAAKASTDAPKEPAPPPSVTVIGAADARGILGRDVRSSAGENMGRIVDVIVVPLCRRRGRPLTRGRGRRGGGNYQVRRAPVVSSRPGLRQLGS